MDFVTDKAEALPTAELCWHCHKPMQLAEEIVKGNEVVARRFICNCGGVLRHYTWHKVGRTIDGHNVHKL